VGESLTLEGEAARRNPIFFLLQQKKDPIGIL